MCSHSMSIQLWPCWGGAAPGTHRKGETEAGGGRAERSGSVCVERVPLALAQPPMGWYLGGTGGGGHVPPPPQRGVPPTSPAWGWVWSCLVRKKPQAGTWGTMECPYPKQGSGCWGECWGCWAPLLSPWTGMDWEGGSIWSCRGGSILPERVGVCVPPPAGPTSPPQGGCSAIRVTHGCCAALPDLGRRERMGGIKRGWGGPQMGWGAVRGSRGAHRAQ